MSNSIKNFKVSYSYPLEYPVKVVVKTFNRLGLVGWLFQKFGAGVEPYNLVITERILEVPTLHEWMGKIFPVPYGKKVLEIGHVASHVSLELASIGYSVTGIDLRPYHFPHKNLVSHVGDFLKHDFKDQKFDCIFSLSTIEHFGFSKRYGGFDQPDNNLDEEAFKKMSALTVSGGYAIVTVPYAKAWCPDIWFKVYTRQIIEGKLGMHFKIEEKRFYRRDNNEWSLVTDPANDPASPHDGVVLFLLKKA